ncbi:MAG: hypothetical protein LBU53_00740 [Zoogloeaceae bacterium]|nr:hypothetical protein [Zoogloeaceae bacterium]
MRHVTHYVLLVANLVNLFFLACIFFRAGSIYSDGPSGFGEMIVLKFLATIALFLFAGGVIISFFKWQPKPKASRIAVWLGRIAICLMTLILTGLGSLCIYDMCSNDKGYCRNWNLTTGR